MGIQNILEKRMMFKGNTIYSIHDFKRLYEYYNQGHFFDKDTMRFFASRILDHWKVNHEQGACYFITSEKKGFNDYTRVYTVRKGYVRDAITEGDELKLSIDTIEEGYQLPSIYLAKKLMNKLGGAK